MTWNPSAQVVEDLRDRDEPARAARQVGERVGTRAAVVNDHDLKRPVLRLLFHAGQARAQQAELIARWHYNADQRQAIGQRPIDAHGAVRAGCHSRARALH